MGGKRCADEKHYYTVQELARIWGCTDHNIYNLIYKGRLPARKMGRRTIILKKELENYLESLPYVREPKAG